MTRCHSHNGLVRLGEGRLQFEDVSQILGELLLGALGLIVQHSPEIRSI